MLKRAVAIQEKSRGPNHPDVAKSLSYLADVFKNQGRYADAEANYKRALAIDEEALGPNHPDVARSLINIASLHIEQGRYADVESLFKRALAILEKALGPDYPEYAILLNNVAGLYQAQGRNADAEPLLERALAIREKSFGPDHPGVAAFLNNLAALYMGEGRYADAEPLCKRSLAVYMKAFGPDHPNVAQSLENLATVYNHQDRYAEAEPLIKQSLAIREKFLGPDHPDVAYSLGTLAWLYHAQGRYADAEPLYERALAIREKSFGPNHLDVARSLNSLASLYQAQGRYADAEPLFKRSLAIREEALDRNNPAVADGLNALASLHKDQRRWAEALPLARRATERGHVNRSVHLSVLMGARQAKDLPDDEAIAESFVVVQRAASTAVSAALSQLSVRFAAGSDDLAQLVRKDQDLSAEQQSLQKSLVEAFSKTPNQRNASRESGMRKRLAETDDARAEVSRVLAQRFPDYAALSKPPPIAVSDVSSLLADDEALVLINLGKRNIDRSYIWVVDRSGAVWNTIDAKSEELETKIAALRASLDPGSNKPFDAQLAYELYKLILGPVEVSIARKPRLLMVMNGALTSLTSQVLITTDPKDLNSVDWLVRKYAVTVLPSVASLRFFEEKKLLWQPSSRRLGSATPFSTERRKLPGGSRWRHSTGA